MGCAEAPPPPPPPPLPHQLTAGAQLPLVVDQDKEQGTENLVDMHVTSLHVWDDLLEFKGLG